MAAVTCLNCDRVFLTEESDHADYNRQWCEDCVDEEKERQMKFSDAVIMMQNDVPMTRTSWDSQDEYIYLEGDIFMKNAPRFAHPLPIVFHSYEILATDWEVVKQRPPQP